MNQYPFNEEDVRLHYRLLNHKYITELRMLKRGLYPVCRVVNEEEQLVSVCRRFNGKRNIYVGLRDRRKGLKSSGRTEDICGLQSIVLDIDPIREPETPSTKKELEAAIRLAQIIKKWCGQTGYREPFIAVTGNGCCLYFPLPFYEIDDKNRLEITLKIESFEHWMRNNFKKELKKYNCLMDPMYDLPRIVRVIGTYNIKGKSTSRRPWRLSSWINKPRTRQEDKKLLRFILNPKIE